MSADTIRLLYLQRRARERQQASSRTFRGEMAVFFIVPLVILSVFTTMGVVFSLFKIGHELVEGLPKLDTLVTRDVSRTTKILDRNGNLLYEVIDPGLGRRTTVSLNQVSPALVSATLAAEDHTFFENPGIDWRGMARAGWLNLTEGEIRQGGSSITQQLVKNVFIPPDERTEASYTRKIREALYALDLTQKYTKTQILEAYLNEIYYGNMSYGIEAAAQSYFGKPALELTLAESAMLAGIPAAPLRFSPYTNPTESRTRQWQVLDQMVHREFVTIEEAEAAKAQELALREPSENATFQAPHFVMYIRDLLEEKFGAQELYYSGLEVTTTLDLKLQAKAERIVAEQVDRTSRTINGNNAALVALDPTTGQVLAMVGSADYYNPDIDGEVNVTVSNRQPGSSFKPITYATAFAKGYSPGTVLMDTPMAINDGFNPIYRPRNFDNSFRGPVTIRQALANSMNIPAIRTIQYTGVQTVLNTAHRMGITTLTEENTYGVALTLGAGEVKPLDMALAYSVFANEGRMAGVQSDARRPPGFRNIDPAVFLTIKDHTGKVIVDYEHQRSQELVLSPEISYLITHILSDNNARVPTFGTALRLNGGRPAAVKTGTTEDRKDFWTIGYTPQLVTAVWMGNSSGQELTGGSSGLTTGPIWTRFMNEALEHQPVMQFVQPPGIVSTSYCVAAPPSEDGAPGDPCAGRRSELIIKGQTPVQRGTVGAELTSAGGPSPVPEQPVARVAPVAPSNASEVCCVIPNVIGMQEAAARVVLGTARVAPAPYANYQGPGDVSAAALNLACVGCVLSSSPAPGAIVPPGTPVYLAVRRPE